MYCGIHNFCRCVVGLEPITGIKFQWFIKFFIKLGVFYGLGGILIVGRVEREERREVRALVG